MNLREPADRELVEAFDRLRADDLRRTPDAADMLARARAEAETSAVAPIKPPWRRSRRVRWGLPGLGVAMAAAIAALLMVDPGDDGADFDRVVEAWSETGGDWRAPTDDLLRMPGDALLRGLPRIGGLPTTSPSVLDAPVFDDSGRENPS